MFTAREHGKTLYLNAIARGNAEEKREKEVRDFTTGTKYKCVF